MAIKAVLFDLDNTLIDFMRMKRACCKAAIEAMIDAGLKTEKKIALKVLFELYNKYGIEHQRVFQPLIKKLTKKENYKILAHGVIAYRNARQTFLLPYPKVNSTLLKLSKRGYKLAIVTDAPRVNAWLRLVTMKLDDFFDVVVTAADVKQKKPGSLPFKKALQLLKVKPEETIMVGDMINRDITGAKQLNIKTIFARYGNPKINKGKSKANFEINNFEELLKILK